MLCWQEAFFPDAAQRKRMQDLVKGDKTPEEVAKELDEDLACDDEYAKKEPLIYQVLKPQDIQCLMVAPMMEAGQEIGFLGVDNPRINTDHKLYLSIAATSAYHELRSHP